LNSHPVRPSEPLGKARAGEVGLYVGRDYLGNVVIDRREVLRQYGIPCRPLTAQEAEVYTDLLNHYRGDPPQRLLNEIFGG